MNITKMNTAQASGSPVVATLGSICLDNSEVQAMRHRMHELANVFTGVMIAGDLLFQHLETESLRHYASHICEGSARGCALVREIRNQLLVACGELEAKSHGEAVESVDSQGQHEIHKSIS